MLERRCNATNETNELMNYQETATSPIKYTRDPQAYQGNS